MNVRTVLKLDMAAPVKHWGAGRNQSEEKRAYYLRNRDRILAATKARYQQNPEAVKLRVKEWQQANRERHNAASAARKRVKRAIARMMR